MTSSSTSGPANSSGEIGRFAVFSVRQPSTSDLVTLGRLVDGDARLWYAAFFQGCDRFVPVFDPEIDTYDSVRARSAILFDIIVVYGARARHGVLSKQYQDLHGLLRQHTSDLVLQLSRPNGGTISKESIQSLLVLASYSDCGAVLCDFALRAALESDMPSRVDGAFAQLTERSSSATAPDLSSFDVVRIWYNIYVLDAIFSLDGGKPSSVSLQSPARRVRSLLSHPKRTTLDLRLFSQVELNALRSSAHHAINIGDGDDATDSAVRSAILDLDLWLSEWEAIVLSDTALNSEHTVMCLNLRIQHTWAVLTLHLRALTASGIENIALMTDSQRDIAVAAKTAAERHLQLLLTSVNNTTSVSGSTRPYIANFRFAMEFVWAKNAFCVLIVLRLGILLGDPPNKLIARLSEVNDFLQELEKVGMGANISYTRILTKTAQKCEKAINASLQLGNGNESSESSETDFQSFIPKEFMFEWSFPGLHLCYIPLDWQDLFLDFGPAA